MEQIAAVIQQMSPAERQRLFELVPEIHHLLVSGELQSAEATDATVERLRGEMKRRLGEASVTDDMPFLGGLTLRQYFDLTENERARLWETEAEGEWDEASEREVNPDALVAR